MTHFLEDIIAKTERERERINYVRMCKTYVLPPSQHTTSSYCIFKNKNYTQTNLILVYKSNQTKNLFRCY